MNAHFLKFSDIAPDEILPLIDRASELKGGASSAVLAGKSVLILFEKPSLRTKLSFWVGAEKLGGSPVYFGPEEVGLGTRESVADVSRVVSRMADLAIVRTFAQDTLEEFASVSSIPVINALTDAEHPCQALADLLAIYEHRGKLDGARVAFIGDGNNTAASLAFAVAGTGGHCVIASPDGYELPEPQLAAARAYAAGTGGTVEQLRSPSEAVSGADIVYTDVWTSMGQEAESAARRTAFNGYQVTPGLLDEAASGVAFMHDLPAHDGEEISEGLLDDPRSIAFDQAENRLWAQAALMEALAGGGR